MRRSVRAGRPSRSLRIMTTSGNAADDVVRHPAFGPGQVQLVGVDVERQRDTDVRDMAPGDRAEPPGGWPPAEDPGGERGPAQQRRDDGCCPCRLLSLEGCAAELEVVDGGHWLTLA